MPFFQPHTSEKSVHTNPFSVIVCAHNELSNLRKLIPQLLIQEYPVFEVIVALDRCTDGSEHYLSSLFDPRIKVIAIDNVPKEWNPKKYALNQAINQAKNEWLLLTDADCVPESIHWIRSFKNHASPKTELILAVGAYHEEKHLISQVTDFETFLTAIQYTSAALSGQAYMGVGRNIAYRKSAFFKSGGFSGIEGITGGDDDLLVQKITNRHNTAVNLGEKSLTYSIPKRTWKGYLGQKTRHLSVGKYYSLNSKIAHTFKSIIHTILWVSFLYLLIYFPSPLRIIAAFGLLVVVKGLFFKKIGNKLGVPFHLALLPVLDFVYAIFLPLLGVRANIVKRIQWN